MDGNHSHNHSDPDLKVLAIAIIAICAIIFGPAIMAALWIMALTAGIGMGLAAIGLAALAVHRLRQPPQVLPPYRQPIQQLRHSRQTAMHRCTVSRYHSQAECNGYHLEITE